MSSQEKANQLPPHSEADLAIDLAGDAKPPFGPIYNLSAVELRVLRYYVYTKLARGLIRPSCSLAGAPILFSTKKYGELRFYVDYRDINRVTRKNR